MFGRLFEDFEQRVGGLLVGAIDVIDQKNPALFVQGFELSALLQQAHLLDGDLPQGAIGREGDEIRMRRKEQRIFVALVGGPFFAIGNDGGVRLKTQVIVLDLAAVTQQPGCKSPRQSGLSHAFGAGQQNGLRNPLLAGHGEERLRGGAVPIEIFESFRCGSSAFYLRRTH